MHATPLLLVCLFVAVFAYAPILPKTKPATSITVLNCINELNAISWWQTNQTSRVWSYEMFPLIEAFQGLINRESDKVYLYGVEEDYLSYDMTSIPLNAGFFGKVPIIGWTPPQTASTPGMNMALPFPCLPFLAQNYSSFIKGKILIPNMLGPNASNPVEYASQNNYQVAYGAALTAAAQESAIILTPRIDTYLQSLGHTYPLIHDLTQLTDPVLAYEWTIKNYFNDKINMAYIASVNQSTIANLISADYHIASGVLTVSLDPGNSSHWPSIIDMVNRYPPNPMIWVEGETEVTFNYPNFGVYVNLMEGPNYSVHSSVVLDPSEIFNQTEPAPILPIDPKGAYIGFFFTDGDSGLFDTGYTLASLYSDIVAYSNHSMLSKLAFSINPHQIDVYPAMVKFFNDATSELTMKYNDGSSPLVTPFVNTTKAPGANTNAYIDQWRAYSGNTGASYTNVTAGWLHSANIGDVGWRHAYTIANLNLFYGHMRYCTCNWAGTEFNWRLIRNTVFTSITPGDNVTDAANKAMNSFPADQPAFAIIAIGDGSSAGELPAAFSVMDAMKQRNDGRNYYYVLPRQVAATWKAWANPPINHAAMRPVTTATSQLVNCGFGSMQDGYCNINFMENCCNATFAFDTYNQSWWQPDTGSKYNSLTVDMDEIISVTSIWILTDTCPFNLSVSTDDSTWSNVFSWTNSTVTLNMTIPISNIPSRYVRYEIYNNCTVTTKVYEIAVYGQIAPTSSPSTSSTPSPVGSASTSSFGSILFVLIAVVMLVM